MGTALCEHCKCEFRQRKAEQRFCTKPDCRVAFAAFRVERERERRNKLRPNGDAKKEYPIETRDCQCGCGKTFMVPENSPKRFLDRTHSRRFHSRKAYEKRRVYKNSIGLTPDGEGRKVKGDVYRRELSEEENRMIDEFYKKNGALLNVEEDR